MWGTAVLPSDPVTTRGRTDESGSPLPDTQSYLISHLLDDCANRLRRLPESRLNKVAGSARDLAQLLADAAQGIENRTDERPPEPRTVPTLSIFALGDQLAVTAGDLAAAARGLGPAELVWWRAAREPLETVLQAAHGAAEHLRQAL